MSKDLADLSILLVEEVHGYLPSRLFSILLNAGRLPLPLLIQRARLSPYHVKCGLTVLVQHQLVHYLNTEEKNVPKDTRKDETVTYYEANVRHAYDLIRTGKNAYMYKKSMGIAQNDLAEDLLFNGPTIASDLKTSGIKESQRNPTQENSSSGLPTPPKSASGSGHTPQSCEAVTEEDAQSSSGDHNSLEICRTLFEHSYAVEARELDFEPTLDYDARIEQEVLDDQFGGAVKGPDEKALYASAVRKQKRKELDSNRLDMEDILTSHLQSQHKAQSKRKRMAGTDADSPVKHRKLDHADSTPKHSTGAMMKAVSGATSLKRSRDEPESSTAKGKKVPAERALKKRKVISDDENEDELHDPYAKDTTAITTGTQSAKCEAELDDPEDELGVRINDEKLDVSSRNAKLVTLTARCLGDVPAKVFEALLKVVERKVKRCFDVYAEVEGAAVGDDNGQDSDSDDEDGTTDPAVYLKESADICPHVKTREIEAELDPDLDLAIFVEPEDSRAAKVDVGYDNDEDDVKSQGIRNGFKRDTGESTALEAGVQLEERLDHLHEILDMLSSHSHRFVHSNFHNTNERAWRVDFPRLSGLLIQAELENYIDARFGPTATRIIRFLHARGRIEERMMHNTTLVERHEAKAVTAELQRAGIVNVQEVPKDTARTSHQMLYLWFFDQDRTRRLLLNQTYRSMTRFLQRLRVERDAARTVLEKAARTDVKGHEDEFLSDAEKKQLADLDGTEEKLLLELGRLDDTVAVLRDFLPMKPSDD